MLFFSFFLLATLLVFGVVIYNRLVIDRNRVYAAWSDIEVQLKRRHDLIPKLVEVVKQVAHYEQSTLLRLVSLRQVSNSGDEIGRISILEGDIGRQIRALLAVVEQYPQLGSNRHFLELQKQISEVEDSIQHARRYYNGAVKLLNVRIASFPDLLVAKLFGFGPAAYFEFEMSLR